MDPPKSISACHKKEITIVYPLMTVGHKVILWLVLIYNYFRVNTAGILRMSSATIFQSDHFVLSTNLLFKFNVSLPLVTGELLQNTVDVNNVTYSYKLYNIKVKRLTVLLNTKNYLSTGQAIT